MSDEEDVVHSEEEAPPPEDTGPSEAQLAMQRRRAKQVDTSGLDEGAQELLEMNKQERVQMEAEIQELRERNERRKREREEEERRLAEQRAAEEARRKAEEEERRRKKDEEERARREERAQKMAEMAKWKNPPKPNFVITKKSTTSFSSETDEGPREEKKSREQLEAEKRAILAQRIQPLNVDGFDTNKLAEKAKELHKEYFRLEGEKYDLEKRFKEQQYDMLELAERARQMNKVGKGGLKRHVPMDDEVDKIAERFAGAPAKIEMYSKYERQKDKRTWVDRRDLYTGPIYGYPPDRIKPTRRLEWGEDGLPLYIEDAELAAHGQVAQEEVPAE